MSAPLSHGASDVHCTRQQFWFDRVRCLRLGAAALGLALTLSAGAAETSRAGEMPRRSDPATAAQEQPPMWMSVGTQRFAVTLEDNPTARAFVQLLPTTLDMSELNGNEKHASLPRSLPAKAARPETIRAGDLMLYGNDTLVVFYATFRSSYSYTRIGRIEESAGLGQALGPGNPRVTFKLP